MEKKPESKGDLAIRLPKQLVVYASYESVLVIMSHMLFRFLKLSPSYLTGSISHAQRWVQWPASVPLKTSREQYK